MNKCASKFYNESIKGIPQWALVSTGTLASVALMGLPLTAIALAGIYVVKTCHVYKSNNAVSADFVDVSENKSEAKTETKQD